MAPDSGRRTISAARRSVLELVEAGVSYHEIGDRLGIHPGLAYFIATGLPADGSDAPSASAPERAGFLETSQHLSNPQAAENSTSSSSVHQWIRQRVAGDAQMQRAASARTADPGPRRSGEEEADMVDVLTRDHNHVTNLLKQLSTIPGVRKGGSAARLSARKSIVDMATAELSRHVTAEQRHLWPTVREVLDDGDDLADRALEMNRHGEDVLLALQRLEGTEEEFDDLVEELTSSSRKHVAFEAPIFLRLRERMEQADLLALGVDVATAEEAMGKPDQPPEESDG